jgi:hypothetical protein
VADKRPSEQPFGLFCHAGEEEVMTWTHRYVALWLVLFVACAWYCQADPKPELTGSVIDEKGPVAKARVGWQGQTERVFTDGQGRFRLASSRSKHIIASKTGYRIASAVVSGKPLTLRLERMPKKDNPDYEWIDPHVDTAKPNNCANCHGEIYREWQQSAHSRSATNPKFLHLFAGTDGKAPVQKKWNAQAEHPDGAAVCATCHAPTLSSPKVDYDIRAAKGVSKSGIHCDYCHKIADAPTNKLGTRFGRDGLRLLRPSKGELLTLGPLDDAVRKGESFACLSVYKESRYCASCHEGIVFGMHAYGTYSEWLESPAKKEGKQCQDCHMAPTGKMTNIAPGKGGIERRPETLAGHQTPGGSLDLLRQSLDMKVQTKVVPNGRQAEVDIVAQTVGHRVPTGFPDRQLVLVVTATDANGQRAELQDGARLPKSAGKWSGCAGALYAKQLVGEKERMPIPFWLHVAKIEDTRLSPEKLDRRSFLFAGTARQVSAQLWYRRFWQEVADMRGWTDNDLLILEKTLKWENP